MQSIFYPLEQLYKFLYLSVYDITGDYGIALILLSLFIYIILFPFNQKAQQIQNAEREVQSIISPQIEDSLINDLAKQKFSGTTNVSYEYMIGSINAFCEGDVYGKFQATINKELPPVDESSKPSKLPPFKDEDDCEFFKNPVVFRAINETRKVINTIIGNVMYGSSRIRSQR